MSRPAVPGASTAGIALNVETGIRSDDSRVNRLVRSWRAVRPVCRTAGPPLDRLLATLSPRQRHVVALRVAVGLSAEETARIVGGTAGTVRLTQHRAVNCLRRQLQPTRA